MGNSNNNPIRNLDKRTARREYRQEFEAAICNYRRNQPHCLSSPLYKYLDKDNISKNDVKIDLVPHVLDWSRNQIRVCVRKRPLFKYEYIDGEFDVVSVLDTDEISTQMSCVVHDARLNADCKRQFISHYEFSFDCVFNDNISSSSVYKTTAYPLIKSALLDMNHSTVMVYGMTGSLHSSCSFISIKLSLSYISTSIGSGKTYTMTSIYQQSSQDIFQLIKSLPHNQLPPKVCMSFFEISGDNINDLLNPELSVSLQSGSDGNFYPANLSEPEVTSSDDMLGLINHGIAMRATAGTGILSYDRIYRHYTS